MKMLVVVASRHGATRGIADRIGEALEAEGIDATVTSPAEATDVATYDGFVIGSGVYMGSWLKEGLEFIAGNQLTLATRPVWLFSSGPMPGSIAAKKGVDPLTDALGPLDGPGSAGRKKIEELTAGIYLREHKVFAGAFDPADPPKTMSERLVRMMPMAKGVLPPGDYRDWDAIDAWAREIAAEVQSLVAV